MALDSIDDVRIFCQVVDSGGFTAAARVLHQHKNRVSQRVAALEASVGVALLHRTTRATRLTEEGERLYAHAQALLRVVEEAELALGPKRGLDGRVRLAMRSAVAALGGGAELVRLMQLTPHLRLQVVVTDAPTDLLADGFDLAVQVGDLRDSTHQARRLADVKMLLAAAPAYLARHGRPRGPEDLVHHQCIRRLSEEPEDHWVLEAEDGRTVAAPITGAFECSDARVQTDALYAGMGIGLGPSAEVRRAVSEGTLERVLPGFTFAPIPVWVVSPRGRMRVARVSRVVELLERLVAKAL